MGRVMQLASFSLAEVTYAAGDISYLVQEQAKNATFRVKARQENVSGVTLPAFEVDRQQGTGAQSGKISRAEPDTLRRFQFDGSRSWWPAGSASERGIREGCRDSC